MKKIINESDVQEGLDFAQRCVGATDYNEKTALYRAAYNKLHDYCHVNYKRPSISLSMGVLSYHLARATLGFYQEQQSHLGEKAHKHPYSTQLEVSLNFAATMMERAGKYFSTAADMKDTEGNFAPAQAKDCLAQLCEQGLLGDGKKDVERAFQLRLEAAEAGWAEAQINLALMYYHAEGTSKNNSEVKRWLGKALSNKDQLSPALQNDVISMLNDITLELQNGPNAVPKTGTLLVRRRVLKLN